MFKNLTNFGYQRNTKEAIGFYLAYFLLVVLVCVILGALVGLIVPSSSFNTGLILGTALAVIASIGISILILKEKNLLGSFPLLLLALLAGILAIFIGALGGFIPVAYLTTRPKRISQTA